MRCPGNTSGEKHVIQVPHTLFLRSQGTEFRCFLCPLACPEWEMKHSNQVDRHLNKVQDRKLIVTESWGKLPAPTPCTTGNLIPPPGVWLTGCALWHSWQWLLLPPRAFPCPCFPCSDRPAVILRLCSSLAQSLLQKQLSWNACEPWCSSYFQECAPTKD